MTLEHRGNHRALGLKQVYPYPTRYTRNTRDAWTRHTIHAARESDMFYIQLVIVMYFLIYVCGKN